MTPESAEQFNVAVETLLRGPLGPIIGFGLVIITVIILSIVEKK